MKNKLLIIGIGAVLIAFLVFFFFIYMNHNYGESKIPLFEMENFKNVSLDNIKNINIVRYTVGGAESILIENFDDIQNTYNELSDIKVGKETNMFCDDNTIIYFITFKTGEEISIQLECDSCLVLNDKRYEIKR